MQHSWPDNGSVNDDLEKLNMRLDICVHGGNPLQSTIINNFYRKGIPCTEAIIRNLRNYSIPAARLYAAGPVYITVLVSVDRPPSAF